MFENRMLRRRLGPVGEGGQEVSACENRMLRRRLGPD
jgi:hypothetical protein